MSDSKLYIVNGTIKKQDYGETSEKTIEKTMAVWATTVEEAEDKFTSYWTKQTDEYSVYYNVTYAEALAAID
jgi:5-methylcytosine-specific restriction endonuclease McrBC GTP-binding regulatory subunit McrB